MLSGFVNLISGVFPFTALIFCGIYLTLKGRFFQIMLFPKSFRLMIRAFKSGDKKGELSSFQAACTSLSAAVGTGNIAGVSGALSIGGAGAVFWMWISAVLGMAVKAAEISVGVKHREKTAEGFKGGPMYYIKNGLPRMKVLAFAFAALGIPAVFCTGNITQANAAITSVSDDKGIKLIIGIIFAVITYISVSGGLGRIGALAERIVPLMSVIYIIICLVIVILNIDFLPEAFKMIFIGAFSPKAVTGGAVGSFVTAALIGAQRGIFSNEAGLGTAAIAHSCAYDADCEAQGLFGIFEVFVDTILICTLTAITVLCSRVDVPYGSVASSELVVSALKTFFGKTAAPIISSMLCLFGFSSIIGWAAYGGMFAEFLWGKRLKSLFMVIYPLGCIFGAVAEVKTAWELSAFFCGIMLCLNLPMVIMLTDISFFKKGRKKYVFKANKSDNGNTG